MTIKLTQSKPNSEFSLLWHQDGHGVRLIVGNLSAEEAGHRLEQLSEECGQPVSDGGGGLFVNESDHEGCGYYYVVEDLPEPDGEEC